MIRSMLKAFLSESKSSKHILWFSELSSQDVSLVGGKNASLGEMYSNLKKIGIKVPNGFTITSLSYKYFVDFNNLKEKISEILKSLDTKNINNLQNIGSQIRTLILKGNFPPDLQKEIEESYESLKAKDGSYVEVAVRSSATTEDLIGASFAGQQETYLNVKGKEALMEAVRKCFASLFTDRAISYRQDKGFGHFKVALSVGVQRMVRSDLGSSGVAFTLDTETGFDRVIVVNGAFGLGELIVQGEVIPDEWIIFKEALKKGFPSIISKKIGNKNKKIIYSKNGGTKLVGTRPDESIVFSLSDEEVITLGKWCLKIEEHFSNTYKSQPMDIEWAKDGKTNELFITQARPETVYSEKRKHTWEEYVLTKKGEKLISGIAVGTKIAAGKARVIKSISEIKDFKKNEILVTGSTDPDWEPIMKIASGIVTDKGGRTSHAAIVARELGIASIVGTKTGTSKIKSGQNITVDSSSGTEGIIYDGILPYEIKKHNLGNLPQTRTRIMVNIGSPSEAFKNHILPVKGVGLGRIEFIITSEIKIHPKALIDYPNLEEKLKKQIDEETLGYKDKKQYFIDTLTYGIAKIAASFWPYQVLIRFSDFKTNEYRSLLGGGNYEPFEQNPMIGFRGASRYYDPKFSEVFRLEIKAIKFAREKLGLLNIVPFIPFVRTVPELKKVMKIIEGEGLKRDTDHIRVCQKQVEDCSHLRIYVMCEVPSNVILADKFLDLVDGYSIGSNDLTQLILGLDRDSEMLSAIGNENDEAVKISIGNVIRKCKEKKKYIGICGQGPSDSIEFAKFLVENKIDSLSLNPDAVVKTMLIIAKIENNV